MATSRRSTGGVPDPLINERPPTRLELWLGHDRASLVVLLILFPLVCWSWIVVMAHDMSGPMTGASAWMMTVHWDARHVFLLWAMWAVMMVGMMLPSAAPLLLLYGVAVRRQSGVLAASRLSSAQPVGGMGLELEAIAAVVIGGTSLQGGKGSIVGTVVGSLIVAVLTNGLRVTAVPQEWQSVVVGCVILVAVYVDMLRKKGE